jgi:hypothetical protein
MDSEYQVYSGALLDEENIVTNFDHVLCKFLVDSGGYSISNSYRLVLLMEWHLIP